MPTFSEDEVRSYLGGTPEKVDEELTKFAESAKLMSSDHPRLVDIYPRQWVAAYGGQIVAYADELVDVLKQLELAHIMPAQAIIRFIDKDEPDLVL